VHRQVTLDDSLLPSPERTPQRTIDVLILDQALENLAQFDPRQARIVELHFFGGLTFAEIALVLKVTERTVKRDWSMARAWLKGELSKSP
jgi:RNA polymerase sigma factor (sigma-70 family)